MRCSLITCYKQSVRFVLLCLALGWIILGSYEAKTLFTNMEYEANDHCNMWLLIYMTFFIDITTSIITIIYVSGIKLCDDTGSSLIKIIYFSEFVISMICILYKMLMSNDCFDFWNNAIPTFLLFVQIHGSFLWIYLIVLIMYLFGKIIVYIYPQLLFSDDDTDSMLNKRLRMAKLQTDLSV